MKPRHLAVGLALQALLMCGGYAATARLGDLGGHLVEWIGVYFAVSLFYIVSCWLATRRAIEERSSRRLLALIWGAAIVFRLSVVGMPPTLSEDLNRYRWQGMLQAAGGDPYTAAPEDPAWESLRDETWAHVNRKDLPSVYGPVYELTYLGCYRLFSALTPDPIRQVWLYRLPFALFELAAALALAWLLRLLKLPTTRILIYLWCPLQIIEFWAQGHNDSLTVLLVILAFAFTEAGRRKWGFGALTMAALAKFWPLILFPFFLLRREQDRWRFYGRDAWVAVPVALAVSWPYFGGIAAVQEVLQGFVGGWRNNDSLFGLVFNWQGRDFEAATAVTIRLLVVSLAGLWLLQLRLTRAAQWAIALTLAFAANCFPWYLSWLIPFLAIHPNAGLLLWTATSVLAYQVLIGYGISRIWDDSVFFRSLEYLPVYGLLAATALIQTVRRFRKRSATAL